MAQTGTVKFFNSEKGFGFIKPDDGAADIFVHISVLRRCQLDVLETGQRVRADVVEGKKGLEADRVALISD